MAEPLPPAEVRVLLDTIRDQKAEIERLRSNQSLLGVLREIALDPSVPPHLRLKAAEVGVSHETPKLSATVGITGHLGGIGEQLDAAARRRRLVDSGLRVVDPSEAGR